LQADLVIKGGADIPDLADLPADIRKRVLVDFKDQGMCPDIDFLAAVGSPPALARIDRQIRSGCIKPPSLYEKSRPITVDGYACRKFPAGSHIYKMFHGAPTEEQLLDYNRKNLDRPSWCGDEYLTYMFACTHWGVIVAYRLDRDLILLDYFNVANLKKLMAEAVSTLGEKRGRNIVNEIKLVTGVGVNPTQQIKALFNLYPHWPHVWYYTESKFPKATALHCRVREVPGLNPMGAIKGVHELDLHIFDSILSRHPSIDGLVRDGIRSKLDVNGIFYHEEYLIKGRTQLEKMRIDRKNPIHWTNWKLPFTPPAKGILLTGWVTKSTTRTPNTKFAQIIYHIDNAGNIDDIKPNPPQILSYNVHGFKSVEADSNPTQGLARVIELIERCNSEAVALYEVSAGVNWRTALEQLGYRHVISAWNGAKTGSALIVVASRHPLNAKVVELPMGKNLLHRSSIIFDCVGVRIAAVHFEIGARYYRDSIAAENPVAQSKNESLRAENEALRIQQLERVLAQKPDLILGDFNFELGDPEAAWLEARGWRAVNDGKQKSTPYNRVDHCWVRLGLNGYPLESNTLVPVNYSDHLPMLQRLWSAER
jgi:endonuclease/exonuclease/phosphatase family metal-dependent hydrolase